MPQPEAPPGIDMPESWDLRYSRQGAPKVPLPMPGAPPRRRQPRLILVLGVLAVIAATAGAAAVAWHFTTPEPATTPEPTVAATTPASEPDRAGPAGSATATTTAAASTSATSSASAKPPAPPPKDERSCFAQLMPDDAFGDTTPNLKGACTGRDAYATTLVLKSAVVAAGGNGVTEAMREWSKLGWYETAAFTAMRAHCCPDAEALTVSSHYAVCQLEEALAYVTNAIDDEAKMKEALDDYHAAVICLTGKGWAGAFGRGGAPYGGERVHFARVMERIDDARGR